MRKRYVVTYECSWWDNPGPMYFRTSFWAYVLGWLVFTTSSGVVSFEVKPLSNPDD